MSFFSTECDRCGGKEHSTDDCPHAHFSTECNRCTSKEHATDDCPHPPFSTECDRCTSKEHATGDCPHSPFSTECDRCQSKNHATDDCPHPSFSTECDRCSSKDHKTDDCPHGVLGKEEAEREGDENESTPRSERISSGGYGGGSGSGGCLTINLENTRFLGTFCTVFGIIGAVLGGYWGFKYGEPIIGILGIIIGLFVGAGIGYLLAYTLVWTLILAPIILIVWAVVWLTERKSKDAVPRSVIEAAETARQNVLAKLDAAEAAFHQKDFPKADELFIEAASDQAFHQAVQERRAKLYRKLVVNAPAGGWSEDIPLVEDKYFRAYASQPIRTRSVDTKMDVHFGEEKLVSVEFANHSRFDFAGGKLHPASFQITALGSEDVEVVVYVTETSNERPGNPIALKNPLSSDFTSGHVIVATNVLATRGGAAQPGPVNLGPSSAVQPRESELKQQGEEKRVGDRSQVKLQAVESSNRVQEQTKQAWAVIQRAIAAHGGPEKVSTLKQLLSKSIGKLFIQGREVGYESQTIYLHPDRVRATYQIEARGRTMTYSHVMNGDGIWREESGMRQNLDERAMLEFREEKFRGNILLELLQGPNATTTVVFQGKTNVNGRLASVVAFASAGHEEVRLYFDDEAGLLTKREHEVTDISMHKVLQEVFLEDYREVQGVKLAHRIRSLRDGAAYSDATFVKFVPNPKGIEDEFDRALRK